MKWEYFQLYYIWRESRGSGSWTFFLGTISEEEGLNKMGNDGWELITVLFMKSKSEDEIIRSYYFKRLRN